MVALYVLLGHALVTMKTPTPTQVESTMRDALEQCGSYGAAIGALENEIETLPLKPVIRERYALARLGLLKQWRDAEYADGNTKTAMAIATTIERSHDIF